MRTLSYETADFRNILMVKVEIIFAPSFQLICCQQGVHEQLVHGISSIEVVGLAGGRCVCDVVHCQLFNGSQYGISAACAEGWMR